MAAAYVEEEGYNYRGYFKGKGSGAIGAFALV
jgi:hypothetical protein